MRNQTKRLEGFNVTRHTLCLALLVAGSLGCRVVDALAPRQMTLTFEPASLTMAGTRVPNGTIFPTVRCDFAATIQAHGGRPSDFLGLVSVTSTWYNAAGTPTNSAFDLPEDWFGSDQLKYNESSVAHRFGSAAFPFTLRMELKYIDPDLATRVEVMTLTCQ